MQPMETRDAMEARKQELMLLQAQREALEMEANATSSELNNAPGSNGEPPVGVKGPLVDSDGFPLVGFDLSHVRERRHRLNCIQTDHKAIMAEIEKSLHALHEAQAALIPLRTRVETPVSSETRTSGTASSRTWATRSSENGSGGEAVSALPTVPIARVNQVSDGSPAASAGLTVGDLVLRFGNVDISHPKGFGAIVGVVRESEGREVEVTVLRDGGVHGEPGLKNLKLIPKTWAGRGLLGVQLFPP